MFCCNFLNFTIHKKEGERENPHQFISLPKCSLQGG